jgi:hypothetical protein
MAGAPSKGGDKRDRTVRGCPFIECSSPESCDLRAIRKGLKDAMSIKATDSELENALEFCLGFAERIGREHQEGKGSSVTQTDVIRRD